MSVLNSTLPLLCRPVLAWAPAAWHLSSCRSLLTSAVRPGWFGAFCLRKSGRGGVRLRDGPCRQRLDAAWRSLTNCRPDVRPQLWCGQQLGAVAKNFGVDVVVHQRANGSRPFGGQPPSAKRRARRTIACDECTGRRDLEFLSRATTDAGRRDLHPTRISGSRPFVGSTSTVRFGANKRSRRNGVTSPNQRF